MTRTTSSRSAKVTPKMAAEPDTSGTPPTAPSSDDISIDAMVGPSEGMWWDMELVGGQRRRVFIMGGKGRVSYTSNRGTGEARFYRNESTKVYDAVITGVVSIISERVVMSDMPARGVKLALPKPGAPWRTGVEDAEEPAF